MTIRHLGLSGNCLLEDGIMTGNPSLILILVCVLFGGPLLTVYTDTSGEGL